MRVHENHQNQFLTSNFQIFSFFDQIPGPSLTNRSIVISSFSWQTFTTISVHLDQDLLAKIEKMQNFLEKYNHIWSFRFLCCKVLHKIKI